MVKQQCPPDAMIVSKGTTASRNKIFAVGGCGRETAIPRHFPSVPPGDLHSVSNFEGDCELPLARADDNSTDVASGEDTSSPSEGSWGLAAMGAPYCDEENVNQVPWPEEVMPSPSRAARDPKWIKASKYGGDYCSQVARYSSQPCMVTTLPVADHYQAQIEGVVRAVHEALEANVLTHEVNYFEGVNGWNVVVKLQGNNPYHIEHLLTTAKTALLEGAAKSKSMYVIGFRGIKPFQHKPNGFEATLGAMRSASRACWHIFKKGFCRHDKDCNKEHPACMVPVNVLLESVMPSHTIMLTKYTEQVADVARQVFAEVLASPYTNDACIKNDESQGWIIEAVANPECHCNLDVSEYILFFAKDFVVSAVHSTENICLMGCGARSQFVSTKDGFTVTLGGLRNKAEACWDFCSKGMCHRDYACRWHHPECYAMLHLKVSSGLRLTTK